MLRLTLDMGEPFLYQRSEKTQFIILPQLLTSSGSKLSSCPGEKNANTIGSHMRRFIGAAALLLLAACSQPPTPDTWTGETTSLDTGVTHSLTLQVTTTSNRWLGTYTVDAARGTFDGTVNAGTIEATLTPSPTCTYALTGSITDDTLTATYAPLDCPGGNTGTWTLNRQ